MIIYDCDYVAMDEKTAVRLFVKEGDSARIIYDDRHDPYIYAIPSEEGAREKIEDLVKVSKEKVVQVLRTEEVTKRYDHEDVTVLKVFFRYPFDVPELREDIAQYATIFEYDIPYVRRYLIDTGLRPLMPLDMTTELRNGREYLVDAVPSQDAPEELTSMSLDIETYSVNKSMPDAATDPIIMISAATGEESHVFCWKACKGVDHFDDEASMLEGFFAFLDRLSPEVFVTYNGDNFDLPYIKKRCEVNGISHPFVSHMKLKGRGSNTSAEVPGMVHVDLYPIVKKNVNVSRYTLEAVYAEYMGREKSDLDGSKIWQYWDDESLLEELVEYSRDDAVSTFEIGEQMLPLQYEMTKIVNQRPFDVARASSSALVEWLLMRHSHELNALIPSPPSSADLSRRFAETYEGAYVVEPIKGLHEHIFYFDFRSLYPSIIISHNVDPYTLDCECCTDNMAPTGHCFCLKEKGFIPAILDSLLSERMRIKERMGKATGFEHKSLYSQQWALKILANSFYGYLGYPRSRWYSKEAAESITAWGRKYINSVIDQAQSEGLSVVYGDTDSLFVCTPTKDLDRAQEFLASVNERMPERMELELEGYYRRGLFVTKKKYALIDDDDKIITKGLEVVRRDWTGIAKKTQRTVLEKILRDADIQGAIAHVQQVTLSLKENRVPIDDLVIDTQLTMALSQYKAIGPHVQIAKRLKERGDDVRVGTIISYLVLKGQGRIRDKVIPVDEYNGEEIDANYYIQNQVIPSVARILQPLGYSKEELEYQRTRQSSLEGWF
ncbi:DNA polymerase [archaeon]|nr:MAG: DNA polymerase [archaeon]